MINNYLQLRKLATYVAAILLLVNAGTARAVSVLSRGDIYMTSMIIGGTATTNYFEFVTLVPLDDGIVIKFTNNAWFSPAYSGNSNSTGAARPNNQITVWRNNTGATIAAGTVIRFDGAGNTTVGACSFIANTCACGAASSAYMAPSTSGQRVFIYQGGGSNPAAGSNTTDFSASGTAAAQFYGTVLFGLGYQAGSTSWTGWLTTSGTAGATLSYIPSELYPDYQVFIGASARCMVYNGIRSGTLAAIKAELTDPTKWSTSTSNGGLSPDNTAFTIVSAPSATTGTATTITSGGAQLNGTVNDNGATTSVTFVYGTSSTLASGNTTVTATPSSIASGSGSTSVSKSISGLSSGTTYYYRVSANSSNGTTNGSILNFTTSTVSTPTLTVTGIANVACNGGNTGSVTVSASGGTPGYTYTWSNGATGTTNTGLIAGIYTCTVADAASMTATVSATVTQPPAHAISAIANSGPVCEGAALTMSVTATGGTTPRTYSWTGPASFTSTLQNPSISSPTTSNSGTYSVTVTDANGCVATGTRTTAATVNSAPTVSAVSNTSVCATSTYSVAFTGTATTFNWVNSNTAIGLAASGTGNISSFTATGSPTVALTSTVTVTPSNSSCSGTPMAFTLTVKPTPTVNSMATQVVCRGNSFTSVNPTSATPGTTFSWVASTTATGIAASGTGPIPSFVATSASVSQLVCSVTVTPDAGGCVGPTRNWLHGVNPIPTVNAISDITRCAGQSVPTFTITGTSPGTQYLWTNSNTSIGAAGAGTTTATFAGFTAVNSSTTTPSVGNFTVTPRIQISGVACFGTDKYFSITVNPAGPNISAISNTSPVCTGNTLNFSSTASAYSALSYAWSGPSSFSATGATPSRSSVTSGAAGTYTLIATDAFGCKDTATTAATVNTTPSITLGSSPTVFSGTTTANLPYSAPSGSPATYSITYSGAANTAGFSNVSGSTLTSSPIALSVPAAAPPATYSGTLTVSNGSCTSAGLPFTVTVLSSMSASISSQTNVSCNGGNNGSAVVSVTGGTAPFTYSWAPSGGSTSTGTSLSAGTYTCTVTDDVSAVATVTVTITQPPVLTANISSQTNVACNGGSTGSATVTAGGGAGGYTYAWSNGGTLATNTGLTAGSYTCTVTDANSCNATTVATITQPPSLTASISSVTNVACNGSSTGAATVTAGGGAGGYTYSWAPSGGTGATTTGRPAGSYTCTVTDANGCTATATATITQPPVLSASISSLTNVACNGANTGSATASVSGGAGGYTYVWSPGGATTATNSGLTAGSYTCTVTDANSCTVTATATITQPPALTASISSVTNVACFGASTGAASVTAGGGAGGYTYSWAPSGGTGATTTGRVAGVYTCTVTDANGCTTPAVATITQPSSGLTISSLTGGGSYCVGNTINLSVTGTGGTGSYTYSWSGPLSFSSTSSSPSLTSVTTANTGVYTATVTDANGCPATGTASITVNTNPGASTGQPFTCAGGSITLSNATGGGTWSSSNTAIATVGSMTGVVTGVDSGVVNITYTVGTGCFSVMSLNVNPPMAPITGTPYVCLNTTSDLDHVMPGGTWSVTTPYYVTVDASTGVITGAHSGGTTVTYTVNSGCSVTESVYTSNVILNITGSLSVCEGSTSMLTVPGYAGATWSTPDSATAYINVTTGALSGVSAGTVPVTVTYGYCYASAIATVNPLPATISGGSAVCAGSTLALSCSTGGGVWSSSNTSKATVNSSGVVTGVAPGTATIYYSLGTGCAASRVVSVGSMPAAITGTTTLCAGSTTVLSCSTLGGTWSSSATGTADVVSGTATGSASYATISGIATGVATISYSMPTGCVQTVNVTIAAPPSTIGGTLTIGTGGSSTLTSSGGGTWSSSNTMVATIGSTTGVVTGSSAGTATITYQVTSTCYTTAEVTVSAPPAITGPASVCKTYTVTLTHGIPGGTWSSSNTAVATIDATTGVVTGVSAGLINITYTMSPGYFSVRSLYVYNNPPAIVGSSTLCTGNVTSMTSTLGGAAIWSSSNTAVATIGSATGVVSGLTAGNTDITYTTTTTGCFTVKSLTVNETPTAISGASAMCVDGVETYVSTPSGGTWSSTAPSIGSIDASTGVVTGRASGGTSIKYAMPSGCFVTKPVTVNALPGTISGVTVVCVGNSIVLTSGTAGATWSSSASGTASVTATTSTSATISGISTGSANISYSNAAGCSRVVGVTVNDAVGEIMGDIAICSGGSVTLTSTTSGGTWLSNSNPRVSVGTSTGIATGGATLGTAVITYRIGTGCFVTKSITNNAALPNIVGTTTTCSGAGSAVTFAIGVSGGTWSSSNTAVATVDAASGLVTGVLLGGTNTNVTITYAISAGCTKSKVITIRPQPIITGADDVSVGATTTFAGSPTGGAWTSSATTVATVNTSGVVSGIATGSATITYSVSGCLNTKGITVTPGASSRPVTTVEQVLFSVFPNPAHGSLSVSTSVAGTFAIYTVDGKLASVSELTEGTNAISMPSGLTAGTYLCRFQGVDGSVQAVRLVYEP